MPHDKNSVRKEEERLALNGLLPLVYDILCALGMSGPKTLIAIGSPQTTGAVSDFGRCERTCIADEIPKARIGLLHVLQTNGRFELCQHDETPTNVNSIHHQW